MTVTSFELKTYGERMILDDTVVKTVDVRGLDDRAVAKIKADLEIEAAKLGGMVVEVETIPGING